MVDNTVGSQLRDEWYARRDGTVRGPFTGNRVSRYILLGRIRLDDELSRDARRWQPVSAFPQLLSADFSGQDSWGDYQALVMARIRYDERKSDRRRSRGDPPGGRERRVTPERRRPDGDHWLTRSLLTARPAAQTGQGRQQTRVFLLAALLATLVVAYFGFSLR